MAVLAIAGFAIAANAVAAGETSTVSRGADYVSPPAIANTFRVDARTLPVVPAWKPGDPIREIPRQFNGGEELQNHPRPPADPVAPHADFLADLQRQFGPATPNGFTTPIYNADGADYNGVYPPDPTGDVGGGYYVMVFNGSGAEVQIYSTADGTIVAGPFLMSSLGSGGACANGLGDGIVVYDHLAERWLLTEFSGSSNTLCTYLSSGSDPVNTTWTRYTFNTPSFPDYPKYGTWTDAYYVGANEGPAVYALDRQSMLAGLPATLQRKTVPGLAGLGFEMLPPASVYGSTPPPAGAPGIFIRDNDDERNDPGDNNPNEDYLELFTLQVDWANPANTTLTGPLQIPEAEYNSEFWVPSGFGAIHQPGTSTLLDPLLEVPMVPVHYRNFGSYEALVGNHVTRMDDNGHDNIAGIRWFELRRTGGPGNPWTLYQQGTYAPQDDGGEISRWMGAIGMDDSGNIALGYSVARADNVYPGLRYVGREATDPPGVMTTAETTLVDGASSQDSFDRWGDYFGMGVDPDDGCTFWFTGMYMPPGGNWRMRYAAFRFDTCGTPTFTTSGTNLTQDVCAASSTPTALQPATITVGSRNGFTDPVTMSFGDGLPTGFLGSYSVNPVTPPGTTDADLTVDNTATPGANAITLRGSADGTDRDLVLTANVSTASAPAATLTYPANGSNSIPVQPTFTWQASAQATSYLIEVATDANFSNIIVSQSVAGTSFQPSAALPTNTQIWWRVTAGNVCGGAVSAVSSFVTQPGPGQCSSGTPVTTLFSDNVENGTNGWTHGANGVADTWTRGNAAHDGSFAWQANNPPSGTPGNQWLVSPAVTLPTGLPGLTLQYWNEQDMKSGPNASCYDGAIVEVSLDGGSTWTQVAGSNLLTTPYDGTISDGFGNPLGGDQGWCGDPAAYAQSIVDLSSWAGQTVQFRFNFGNDHFQHRSDPAWAIDDIVVQGCGEAADDTIFEDGFDGTP
ncbi:MAG: hypothetical protein U1F23_10855 [Lysobacterales bacterium]